MLQFVRSNSAEELLLKDLRHFVYKNTDEAVTKEEKKDAIRRRVEAWELKGRIILSESRKSFRYVAKKRKRSKTSETDSLEDVQSPAPVSAKPAGDVTILLFYAYATPQMSRAEQDEAISFCYDVLSRNGMTGRLRVGREGFNATLTGRRDSTRVFTSSLREKWPHIFGGIDFKYVDGLPENQLLKGLKVFPVTEIVTYGLLKDVCLVK